MHPSRVLTQEEYDLLKEVLLWDTNTFIV
jgi:hypothetical protein